jgi:hypothetical protein
MRNFNADIYRFDFPLFIEKLLTLSLNDADEKRYMMRKIFA